MSVKGIQMDTNQKRLIQDWVNWRLRYPKLGIAMRRFIPVA